MSFSVDLHGNSDLRVLRNDNRFVESSVASPNVRVDSESNAPTATRTAKKVTGDLFVFLSRHLLGAVGTRVNIPVVARRTHRRQDGARDTAAVQARFTLGLLNGGNRYPVPVSIIAKDSIDFVR